MEKVKILEPFEYIRNETPEEFEEEERNEKWTEQIDGIGMYIGGGLGTLLMVAQSFGGLLRQYKQDKNGEGDILAININSFYNNIHIHHKSRKK